MIIEKLQLDKNGQPMRNHRGTLIMENTYPTSNTCLPMVVKQYFGEYATYKRDEADSPLEIVVYSGETEIGLVSLTKEEFIKNFEEQPNFGE